MPKKRTKRTNKKTTIRNFSFKTWQILFVVGTVVVLGILVFFVTNASAPPRSVKEFGAVGNGVTDDTEALQTAIDTVSASGTAANRSQELTLPPGTYNITRPLIMKSFVQFRGTRGQSVIVNVAPNTPDGRNKMTHILLGVAHPWAFDERNATDAQGRNQVFTNIAVAQTSWAKDSTSLNLKNSNEASKLAVGEIACIRSEVGFKVGDYEQPDFVQFNKIRAINGNKIEFADKALNAIPNPQICKVEGRSPFWSYVMGKDIPWQAAQWVEISGITFRGGEAGLGGSLCYACFVKQVDFENIVTPMAMNALVKNIFSDINATYTGRAIEIKMASSQSSFKNINLRYIPKGCANPSSCNLNEVWPVDIGERSVDIGFNNININDSGSYRKVALFSVGDARSVRLHNSNMTVVGGNNRNAVLEIRSNSYTDNTAQSFRANNFWIENNSFILNEQVQQLAILGDKYAKDRPTLEPGYEIKNILFKKNKWSGTRTKTGIAYLARSQVKDWAVIDDVFNNVASRMVVDSTSTPPKESGIRYSSIRY